MSVGIPPGLDPRYFEGVAIAVTTFVVIWLGVASITGWLAGRRNWDDGLWAVLALLTGPVALLIVLFAPKRLTPPSTQSGPTYREAVAAPGWPVFPAREPRMTTGQRRISTALAGLLGGGGAALIAGDARPVVLVVVVAGAVAAATVGRWLAPSLVASTLGRKAWVVLVTSTATLSIAAFLVVAVLGVPTMVVGGGGAFEYAVYLASAVFYPVISAIFYPAPFVATIVASSLWVAATWILVSRDPASAGPVTLTPAP